MCNWAVREAQRSAMAACVSEAVAQKAVDRACKAVSKAHVAIGQQDTGGGERPGPNAPPPPDNHLRAAVAREGGPRRTPRHPRFTYQGGRGQRRQAQHGQPHQDALRLRSGLTTPLRNSPAGLVLGLARWERTDPGGAGLHFNVISASLRQLQPASIRRALTFLEEQNLVRSPGGDYFNKVHADWA